jgi:hypothetical protein
VNDAEIAAEVARRYRQPTDDLGEDAVADAVLSRMRRAARLRAGVLAASVMVGTAGAASLIAWAARSPAFADLRALAAELLGALLDVPGPGIAVWAAIACAALLAALAAISAARDS